METRLIAVVSSFGICRFSSFSYSCLLDYSLTSLLIRKCRRGKEELLIYEFPEAGIATADPRQVRDVNFRSSFETLPTFARVRRL